MLSFLQNEGMASHLHLSITQQHTEKDLRRKPLLGLLELLLNHLSSTFVIPGLGSLQQDDQGQPRVYGKALTQIPIN